MRNPIPMMEEGRKWVTRIDNMLASSVSTPLDSRD